jgi:DNA-binding GntR family transcriptional regulator
MMQKLLPPAKELEANSLVASVYETLLEKIVSGQLPSGSKVSEVVLAKALQVSRTPVHDALRQLAKDGLVHQEKNRRAVIARFTADDVYEIFELRKLLEGHAAELAAGRMDARQLDPLELTATHLRGRLHQADWAAQWAAFDEQFHREIALSCGNQRLGQDILRYRLLHRGFNKLGTTPEGLLTALAEHEAILAALKLRDGKLARERMVAHIEAWQQHFIRAMAAGQVLS